MQTFVGVEPLAREFEHAQSTGSGWPLRVVGEMAWISGRRQR